ncbi:hypothetical protein VTN31DRAFT_2376 [Thermomyces dupontii]|uniref:uncharacterized protein n=1 Tax=Talaromyces thermophilus TaxID=28565 RepID=UPI0037440867
MSGAFDHVSRDRLVEILRYKGVPDFITGWVRSFMSDRRTTFAFNDNESELMPIPAGIPQGSPISPIPLLFYNSELVEICNPRDIRVHGLDFVDDVNLLAWGPTTQSNCAALEGVHERCLDWARRHGAKFSPEKYELLHLTRNPRANTRAGVRLGETLKKPHPPASGS